MYNFVLSNLWFKKASLISVKIWELKSEQNWWAKASFVGVCQSFTSLGHILVCKQVKVSKITRKLKSLLSPKSFEELLALNRNNVIKNTKKCHKTYKIMPKKHWAKPSFYLSFFHICIFYLTIEMWSIMHLKSVL